MCAHDRVYNAMCVCIDVCMHMHCSLFLFCILYTCRSKQSLACCVVKLLCKESPILLLQLDAVRTRSTSGKKGQNWSTKRCQVFQTFRFYAIVSSIFYVYPSVLLFLLLFGTNNIIIPTYLASVNIQ